jgi:hypothetical protein
VHRKLTGLHYPVFLIEVRKQIMDSLLIWLIIWRRTVAPILFNRSGFPAGEPHLQLLEPLALSLLANMIIESKDNLLKQLRQLC